MATYSFLAKYLGIIWRAAVLTRDILIAPASNNVHRLKLYAQLSLNFYQIGQLYPVRHPIRNGVWQHE